jgi:hypothetical protein
VVFGGENRDAFLWSGLLAVQSLPYVAALITSMVNAMPHLHFRRRRTPAPAHAVEIEAGD